MNIPQPIKYLIWCLAFTAAVYAIITGLSVSATPMTTNTGYAAYRIEELQTTDNGKLVCVHVKGRDQGYVFVLSRMYGVFTQVYSGSDPMTCD